MIPKFYGKGYVILKKVSKGKVGGFFSGKNAKIKLLKSEGVGVLNGRLELK